MAQINFRIDDDIKSEAETLFNSLGMNTTTALMIFIRQSLTERAIPFAIRQYARSADYATELTARMRDLESGRNCHVHDLIDADATACSAPRRGNRHAKALA